MKIVHISTNDIAGGAARAAYRLHRGLLALGYTSQMYVARQSSDDRTVTPIAPPAQLISRLGRRLRAEQIESALRRYRRTRPAGLEAFSDDRSRYGRAMVRGLPPCDIVNLHWSAGFIDFQPFFRSVPARVPLVWRLDDMYAFTGGCHYDEECGRYVGACGACPQLGSHVDDDLSRQVWRRKRAALGQVPLGRLHIVALNQWLAGEVRRSALLHDVPVSIIPNGLDTTAYAPRDRRFARALFDIPQDAHVVLFVAQSLGNRRKGFPLLAEALKRIADHPNLYLVSIGRGSASIDARIPHLALGSVDQDRLLSLVYSAADLFVVPSLQDNMPNTVVESIACGTPVVGFDVGGVPELVRENLTGRIVPKGDVVALGAAINALLDNAPLRYAMAEHCRRIALAEYDQALQVRRFVDLYASLLDPPRASRRA